MLESRAWRLPLGAPIAGFPHLSYRSSGADPITARAVVVLDENDKVVHRQLVPEIGQEPDYDAALKAVR